jgi:cation:H+ antiporter
MLLELATLLTGFIVLTWSADRFVMGAAGTARTLGAPAMIIGITVVGFGTSAPEILISAIASWEGQAGIAMGNALGSNIANIALILGVTALLYPLAMRSSILTRELPLLAAVTVATFALVVDGVLARWEGGVLLLGLGCVMAWLIVEARRGDAVADALGAELAAELPEHPGLGYSLGWLLLGLALLLLSSRAVVWASVSIAQAMGISDLVIGLSVIALGTSLPELATCIASARKGESDIALGNIIGSNIFNLFAVLGIAGSITSLDVERVSLTRDFPVMAGLTVALFVFGWGRNGPGRLGRWAGISLLACYLTYQLSLGLSLT